MLDYWLVATITALLLLVLIGLQHLAALLDQQWAVSSILATRACRTH